MKVNKSHQSPGFFRFFVAGFGLLVALFSSIMMLIRNNPRIHITFDCIGPNKPFMNTMHALTMNTYFSKHPTCQNVDSWMTVFEQTPGVFTDFSNADIERIDATGDHITRTQTIVSLSKNKLRLQPLSTQEKVQSTSIKQHKNSVYGDFPPLVDLGSIPKNHVDCIVLINSKHEAGEEMTSCLGHARIRCD